MLLSVYVLFDDNTTRHNLLILGGLPGQSTSLVTLWRQLLRSFATNCGCRFWRFRKPSPTLWTKRVRYRVAHGKP